MPSVLRGRCSRLVNTRVGFDLCIQPALLRYNLVAVSNRVVVSFFFFFWRRLVSMPLPPRLVTRPATAAVAAASARSAPSARILGHPGLRQQQRQRQRRGGGGAQRSALASSSSSARGGPRCRHPPLGPSTELLLLLAAPRNAGIPPSCSALGSLRKMPSPAVAAARTGRPALGLAGGTVALRAVVENQTSSGPQVQYVGKPCRAVVCCCRRSSISGIAVCLLLWTRTTTQPVLLHSVLGEHR